MANLAEIARSINSYGKTGRRSNPMREFTWVLKNTVREDVSQAEQVHDGENSMGVITRSQMYAQRAVEIGYIFTEVFVKGEYETWKPKSDSPRIIDLGGDPGIFSVMYFKGKAPKASITVVEANPATANVMRENLKRRGLEGVRVINAAVAGDINDLAALHLHKPRKGWHTQDYIGDQNTPEKESEYTVTVPKIKLSEIVNGDQIDLLKMDIEGAEGEVMRELLESGKLKQIDQLIMEFHHDPLGRSDNSLSEMLDILRLGDFEITDAHITSGEGLRKKRNIPLKNVRNIAAINRKIFLTLGASRTS